MDIETLKSIRNQDIMSGIIIYEEKSIIIEKTGLS